MRLAVPAIAAVALALAACSNPFSSSKSTVKAPEEAPEVKTAINEFVTKYNAHDAAGVGAFYADDENFRWIEDGNIAYESKAAALTGLTNFFEGFRETKLEVYDMKISMLTEDSAVASFHFNQIVAANSQASIKLTGTMTLAMADRDGWKIVVAHKNGATSPH